MKYCLRYGHRSNLLNQADEIKVTFKDRAVLLDIFEKYPDKTIILSLRPRATDELDWTELDNYNTLSRGKLMLEAFDTPDMMASAAARIPFYCGIPVTSFYQAKALVEMGVQYLNIDAPIFFQLPQLKQLTKCPLRVIPNLASKDGYYRKGAIHGSWIRPEDTDIYAPYITTYEFYAEDPLQEEAIFDTYKNKQEWKVRLDLLISDLNYPAINRLIPKEAMSRRIECGQRCECGAMCRVCDRALMIANEEFIEEAKAQIESN